MPAASSSASTSSSGSSRSASSASAELVELGVQRVGQLDDRAGAQRSPLRARGFGLLAVVESDSWPFPGCSRRAARGAGSAAPGRRGRRYAGRAAPGRRRARCRRPAPRASSRGRARVQRRLEVVAGLGHGLVGQPRGQRRLVVRRRAPHVDVRAAPATAGRRPRDGSPPGDPLDVAARPGAQPPHASPTRLPRGRARPARPAPCPARARRPRPRSPPRPPARRCVSVANSRSRSTRNSSSSNSRCTASRSHGRTTRSSGVAVDLDVADQLGELAVEQHVRRGSRAARRRPCPSPRRPGRPGRRASRTRGSTSPPSSPPRRGCRAGCPTGRRAAPRSPGTGRA